MLKYKQIWHGIKPIRWLNKFNLTINYQETNFPSELLRVRPNGYR